MYLIGLCELQQFDSYYINTLIFLKLDNPIHCLYVLYLLSYIQV
jgi:hypothetical protein